MSRRLVFPVEYSFQGSRETFSTFEPIAIPPRHELVSAVHSLIFSGEELVLVRRKGEWSLPGSPRRSGETFQDTLVRTAWDSVGALLQETRMLGVVKVAEQQHADTADQNMLQAPESQMSYEVWFLAEARDLLPFSREFEAEDRMQIEPELVPTVVEHWSPLLQAILEYAQAIRTPIFADMVV